MCIRDSGKNVVLLVAAVSVFKWQDLLVRFITPKMEWMISMYTLDVYKRQVKY